jgi:hypothetical protein
LGHVAVDRDIRRGIASTIPAISAIFASTESPEGIHEGQPRRKEWLRKNGAALDI